MRYKLQGKAPGLTPRSALEQLSSIQMLDVYFPTADGRWLIFKRYTMPEKSLKLLLAQLNLQLPAQPRSHITSLKPTLALS